MNKEEILKEADIVSLHVPLLPSTIHLVDEKAISTMKQSAVIINTARGAVIDEIALVKALKEKRIRGAGVDVYEFEPYLPEGVTTLENIVMTPHIASARESVRIRMSEIVAENIISFFETGKAITSVMPTE
jgi:lactate dehydrogenase-like 2-hydroxyacid dehydrogenase